ESGLGIFAIAATDVVIERCEAYNNGWLPGNHSATGGIVAIYCNNVLLQYNESYNNHPGAADGDGIVFDICWNSVMQFNYTHDNDGGGLWLGAEPGFAGSENVIRYNISQNDGRMGYPYAGNFNCLAVSNSHVYNNTIFNFNSSSPAIVLLSLSG